MLGLIKIKNNWRVFCVILVIAITVIINTFYQAGIAIFPEYSTSTISFVREVDVKTDELFSTMSDITNYPSILPDNVLVVMIINQTDTVIFAQEKVAERGISTDLLVKHTIIPNKKHVIEVVQGDARGSFLEVSFEDLGASTKLTIKEELHLRGVLIPFSLLPKHNLESATNTVISAFVEYAKKIIS